MTSTYNEVLKLFGDRPAEMLDFMKVLSDEESRILLTKLTGPNTPLMADSLPYTISKGTKLSNLSKLQELTKLGLVEENEIKEGNKTLTRYHATEKAKTIMNGIHNL